MDELFVRYESNGGVRHQPIGRVDFDSKVPAVVFNQLCGVLLWQRAANGGVVGIRSGGHDYKCRADGMANTSQLRLANGFESTVRCDGAKRDQLLRNYEHDDFGAV